MSNINIPFNAWSLRALADGKKSATTRSKPYGKPGDTFAVGDTTYALLHVEKVSLGFVADFMYREEGCASTSDFRAVWKAIHPKRGFYPNEVVWLHTFYKVEKRPARSAD